MTDEKGPYRRLKYFLGSMIVLVIIACLAPFFLKGPDDKALLTPDRLKLPDIKLPGRQEKDTRPQAEEARKSSTSRKVVIYRWQDKDGAWHFTDYPNPDGPYEVIYVTPDPPGKKDDQPPAHDTPSESPGTPGDTTENLNFPLTPSNVQQLKQEADRLQQELEKRYQELNEMKKASGGK